MEEQQGFEPLRAVIVQEVIIPAGLDKFVDKPRVLALRMLASHLQYITEDGLERTAAAKVD
jgi:hypothetical protein